MYIIFFKIDGGTMWHIHGPFPTKAKADAWQALKMADPKSRWRLSNVKFCDPD